ncbi:MAG TPA: DsbA family protein [Candidatus Sulfotelmatobacter sp.]|nr:DsbA family protein [Candidatus Sulfotelmatobacter sp.]
MAPNDPIDFWFSVGSTYSYLTISRLAQVETASGIRFNWRPFNVRAVMLEMNNIPFTTKPVKLAYMWRDVERRAARYGLPVKVPAPYPLPELELANRVAILGREEGWCADYARATYRRWFVAGEPAGSEPNLSASLRDIGQDPMRVLPLAGSDRIGSALAAATDAARKLGIFGAPTFITRGELFWGDDRLDDALAWHAAEADRG